MALPILLLDFDGVAHSYTSGWQGVDVIPDPPVDGLQNFLATAIEYFEIHIHSSRSSERMGRDAMRDWFLRYVPVSLCAHLHFPEHKPPAMVTLDDRALTFTGIWPDPRLLRQFQPWTTHTPPPNEQPSAPVERQQQWTQAIALLENQIKYLGHEPDIAFDLEALWVMLVRLREQEQAGVSP